MTWKLSRHAFTRFWDLHAWSGVLGGLVLYVMFLAGAITLFHEQLGVWEEPLAQRPARGLGLEATLARGLGALGAPPREMWFEPPGDDYGSAKLYYQRVAGGEWESAWIDPDHPRLVPERERLKGFLYSLHFLWHDAVGDWLYYCAGLLAVALLVALATGALIHLKDLVAQFHQFRPDKSRRVLWSDLHKVLGVMGLPFQLLYAYTGAFIVLAPLLLHGFVGPVFGGDERRAERVAEGHVHAASTPGAPAAVLDFDTLAMRAKAARPDLTFDGYELRHHGRANGELEAWGRTRGTPAGRAMVLVREVDGAVVDGGAPHGEAASAATRRWIQGLHYAHFGGTALRFVFFGLALATCATILTGNWVWLARRAVRRSSSGHRVLARLTAGVGAGTFVAVAALFLASRLLALDLPLRGTVEELVFVTVLVACSVWALVANDERTIFWQQLGIAGVLLTPVPFLAARWSTAGLFGAGPRLAPVVGVDVALLVTSAALCTTALALRRAARAAPTAAVQTNPSAVKPRDALAVAGGPDA
jgi:uncharacterized iron-regulated membrane protein